MPHGLNGPDLGRTLRGRSSLLELCWVAGGLIMSSDGVVGGSGTPLKMHPLCRGWWAQR